jgi:PAS domain S-box-containing protein
LKDEEKTKAQLISELTALRRSEEQYRRLLDEMSDGYVVTHRDRIVFANRPMAEMIGCSVEEIVGRSWKEFFGPEVVDHIDQTPMVDLAPLLTAQTRRLDGSELFVEMSLRPATYEGGLAEFTLVRDVTERVQAKEALRQSQRTLLTLMSNLPGMAYRCRNEPDWPMEFVSEGSVALTGYEPHDLIESQTVAYGELIHPDDRDAVWDGVQAAIRENKPFELVYRIICANGEENWVWEKGRKVFSPGGEQPVLEGFITDITERVRAEEALRQRTDQLEALREMDSSSLPNWIWTRFYILSSPAPLNCWGELWAAFFSTNRIETCWSGTWRLARSRR